MALSQTSGPPLPPTGGAAVMPGVAGAGAGTVGGGMIAGATATPMPVAAPPLIGGGATVDASAGSAGISMETLTSVASMISMLIGLLSAQNGAAGVGVTGGGAAGAVPGGMTVSTSSSVLGTSSVGGAITTNPNGWSIVDSTVAGGSVIGGGAAAPGTMQPNVAAPVGGSTLGNLASGGVATALAMNGVSTIGGGAATIGGGTGSVMLGGTSSAKDWSIIDGTGAAVSTSAAMGGGAPAVTVEPDAPVGTPIDMRRVAGTPQPGGPIANILATAKVSSMPAMAEGAWIVLQDGAGAQMQLHAHGRWATATADQVNAGIAAGQIGVHIHADSTVHLHDIM